jgi:hypothetical protein
MNKLSASIITILLVMPPQGSALATEANDHIGEVVVTAQRRY